MCATAAFVSARKHSATFWSRCRPTAAARLSAAPTITIRLLPPRHALVAFGLWLQHVAKADALVHMGAHGTLEWLPGKAVALTAECFPEIVTGALPVIYPFIVSNPGEAAQAKRRIAGLTIGHLPPPLVDGGLSGEARELERLIDEYAQADGLDRRRRERLAALIVETAQRTGLAREAGIASAAAPDDALRRIDAWLCDLKDLAIKDGLHVYGRAPAEIGDPAWQESAAAERAALLAALDGHRVAAGPAGSPTRGRRDVLPTGRNLFTADPRTLPTPTAMDLGRLAADEVVRAHLQAHGEFLRAVVIDLWGSATLRTGGEEIAQGFALMGCRPLWDGASGRVTGVEVLPTAAMGRARVDVTWRISGLFRDLFPAQIALIDAAVQAVAARDEERRGKSARRGARAPAKSAERPASTASSATRPAPTAPASRICSAAMPTAQSIGAAYLAAASHAYGGAGGEGGAAPGAFAQRIAAADLLVHPSDDPGRDLLEGAEDAAFVGGFAAAAKLLGRPVDLVMLDLTDPQRPRARSLAAALGADRAGARDQPALHRRADAPRPARRRRACRNRRPARRLRANDRRGRQRIVRPAARRLRRRPQGARLSAAGKSAGCRGDRRAARRHAAARFLASAPQRCRRRPRGTARRVQPGSDMRARCSGKTSRRPLPAPLRQSGKSTCSAAGLSRLSTPMPTGDGWLVRLLPIGTIALDAFAALCDAAQAHGNGVIEVTGRGSIQVRGLTPNSAPRFAAAIGALEIAAADGIPVLSNALAGLDPEEMLDASALAARSARRTRCADRSAHRSRPRSRSPSTAADVSASTTSPPTCVFARK